MCDCTKRCGDEENIKPGAKEEEFERG
jgi:hypothetical protein